jgi:hypothetical protein
MALRKTANGKTLDMNSLIARHERTRAVGNMNVNARGDTIDSHNRVIADSSKRVNSLYNKTMQRGKHGANLATPVPKEQKAEVKEETKKSDLMDEFDSYDDGWDEKQKK